MSITDSGEKPTSPRPPQLRMIWPDRLVDFPPAVELPPDYELRTYTAANAPDYIELMESAGFGGWTPERIEGMLQKMLADGFFLILHRPSQQLVATAMATHNPTDQYPAGGELGWVAANPAHQGKGLGRAVCAAVVNRMLEAGYRQIYLLTDDWRIPAIKTYLRLGFEPVLNLEGMPERWAAIHRQIEAGS